MSGNPGCAPSVHWSPLQPVWSEPSTPGRRQPYSTWAKTKICPCLGSLMHPGAEILLHMCIFAFGAGQRNSPDTKSRVTMSSALESDSLLCLTHWILTTHFSLLCFFPFISAVCLHHGIRGEGLFLSSDTIPRAWREGRRVSISVWPSGTFCTVNRSSKNYQVMTLFGLGFFWTGDLKVKSSVSCYPPLGCPDTLNFPCTDRFLLE